jgi:hypothetical protein
MRQIMFGVLVTTVLAGTIGSFSGHAQGLASAYAPPKTPWGHPDLQGQYTNKDEANTPLERPDEFKGRRAEEFTSADLARLAKERQAAAAKIAGGIGGAETGAGPTHWYEHLQGHGSRPWCSTTPATEKGAPTPGRIAASTTAASPADSPAR